MENNINLKTEIGNNQENENQKLELKIDGISCQACVAKIERKLSKTNGAGKALVLSFKNTAYAEESKETEETYEKN